MKVDFICHTDGSGFWSFKTAAVRIIEIRLNHFDADTEGEGCNPHGELHAVFDRQTWNVEFDGLIHTDPSWETDFRAELRKLGCSQTAVESVGYSEQGMQGEDYVSLDVGPAFFSGTELPSTLLREYAANSHAHD